MTGRPSVCGFIARAVRLLAVTLAIPLSACADAGTRDRGTVSPPPLVGAWKAFPDDITDVHPEVAWWNHQAWTWEGLSTFGLEEDADEILCIDATSATTRQTIWFWQRPALVWLSAPAPVTRVGDILWLFVVMEVSVTTSTQSLAASYSINAPRPPIEDGPVFPMALAVTATTDHTWLATSRVEQAMTATWPQTVHVGPIDERFAADAAIRIGAAGAHLALRLETGGYGYELLIRQTLAAPLRRAGMTDTPTSDCRGTRTAGFDAGCTIALGEHRWQPRRPLCEGWASR